MSKRSYNDIERIIKNAAEANEPAFDELAWQKMEILLDKEKERKRPFIFWWWLMPLLIVAGLGGYFILNNQTNFNNQPVTSVKNNIPSTVINTNKNSSEIEIVTPDAGNVIERNNEKVGTPGKAINSQKISFSTLDNSAKANKNNVSASINYQPDLINEFTRKKNSAGSLKEKTIETNKNIQTFTNDVNEQLLNKKKETEDRIDRKENIMQEPLTDDKKNKQLKEDIKEALTQTDTVTQKEKVQNNSEKRKSKFYFMLSAGVEGNGVKLFSAQKITVRTGAGIGFQFNKNISLQTGFFAGNKKYIAGPDDYKTKAGTYWSIVDITKVDANCRVYEVPLSIRYDFNTSKKLSYFSSVGLSSFFMNKEDYHYYYNHYGAPQEGKASYTGNQHLFSVLRIAAGIERQIASGFSLNVSPGFTVPLAGVGEGQVKLFSTDIMVGIKFIPIRKSKK